jgi:CRISPR type III-B/RAMP module RAMP protein Cmr6
MNGKKRIPIPMLADVAAAIGPFAEEVENRSLLLDKFILHKKWGMGTAKVHDASRWSLLRVTEGGPDELKREALALEHRAKDRDKADLAKGLARTRSGSQDAQALRKKHSQRLQELVQHSYREKAFSAVMRLESRLAINLSDGLIENAGICLDRVLGLPYIPGSAVKGIARHAALAELAAAPADGRPGLLEDFVRVFGTADNDFGKRGELATYVSLLPDTLAASQKGGISFLPAYPVNEARIVVDLTNVHTPYYYTGNRRKNLPAGDPRGLAEESPRPNAFPAVERGAAFLFMGILNGQHAETGLLEKALQWIRDGLESGGIGAKTGAGYGWLVEDRALGEKREEALREQAEEEEAEQEEAARLAAMDPEERCVEELRAMADEPFANFARELASKDEPEQRAFTRVMADKDKREKLKKWKKRKPALASAVEEIIAQYPDLT